jgi:hypothetical protein
VKIESEPQPFSLDLSVDALRGVVVRVYESPAGEGGSEGKPLRWPLAAADPQRALRDLIDRNARSRAEQLEVESACRELGRSLFSALLRGENRTLYEHSITEAGLKKSTLRLELRIDPRLPELAELVRVPWEVLAHPEGDFLCLEPDISLVRHVPIASPLRFESESRRLTLLLAGIQPVDSRDHLDLDREATAIRERLQDRVAVVTLAAASWTVLREALEERDFDILHFMGHGVCGVSGGSLLLADEHGKLQRVPDHELARHFRGRGRVRLVVLNACESGRAGEIPALNPYAGTAMELVRKGLPAVVAMQFPISDHAAVLFSEQFYDSLADGERIEGAVACARSKMSKLPRAEWVTPVLYQRGSPGPVLTAGLRARKSFDLAAGADRALSTASFQALLVEKTRSFAGREWAVEKVRRFAMEHPSGYVFVTGPTGAGKTTLLATLVKREALVHHFDLRAEGIVGAGRRVANLHGQICLRYGLVGHGDPRRPRGLPELTRLLADASPRAVRQRALMMAVDLERDEFLDGDDFRLTAAGLPESLPSGVYGIVALPPSYAVPRVQAASLDLGLGDPTEARDGLHSVLDQRLMGGTLGELPVDPEGAKEILLEHSGGNFLLLELLLDELAHGRLCARFPTDLPVGLPSYFEWKWNDLRRRWGSEWIEGPVAVLVALARHGRAATLEDLCRISGIASRSKVRRILDEWAPLAKQGSLLASPGGAGLFRFAHECVLDFLLFDTPVAAVATDVRSALIRLERLRPSPDQRTS